MTVPLQQSWHLIEQSDVARELVHPFTMKEDFFFFRNRNTERYSFGRDLLLNNQDDIQAFCVLFGMHRGILSFL